MIWQVAVEIGCPSQQLLHVFIMNRVIPEKPPYIYTVSTCVISLEWNGSPLTEDSELQMFLFY